MKLLKLRKSLTFSALLFSSCLVISTSIVSAFTYNNNNVMDDAVFNNYNSMNAGQIDSFLNSFPNSCLSTKNGFSAIDPTGYNHTDGYLYGNNVSAGQVIYDAAQAYQINPQVLLSTLQKEQSIVDGSAGCSTNQYAKAAGYGCPDGGTSYSYSNVNLYTKNGTTYTSVSGICVNTAAKAGFSQQVIHAAWMLKYSEQRSEGNINWAIIKGNWDNSDDLTSTYTGYMTQGCFKRSKYDSQCTNFDGYATIDSTAVHMDTGATAALYRYTPHFSGNQHFDTIFNKWFGNPLSGTQLTNSLSTNTLAQNTTMHAGDYIVSPNGKFVMVMQYDGNLITFGGSKAVWSSGTSGNYGAFAVFQNDGNFVIYNSSGSAVWSSATDVYSANNLALGDDGNTVISVGTTQKWSTNIQAKFGNPVGANVSSQTFIHAGDYLLSSSGQFAIVMQYDGNLVEYTIDGTYLWSSGTAGNPGAFAVMQYDGNLVIYSSSGKSLWSSGTAGNGASSLYMQGDSNLVIYKNGGGATWANGAWAPDAQINNYKGASVSSETRLNPTDYLRSSDWRYTLVMQTDGNLVLYAANKHTALWSSHTAGNPGAFAVMQYDGNLVIYSSSGKSLWSSGTAGNGASSLYMQGDSNLVIYKNGGGATWASNTIGGF